MRIKYIDALRGFTMFLVVFMHVMILSFGVEDSVLSVLFKRIRMPMFFFISGYIGFKALDKFTRQGTWELLKKKSFVQLVPTFIFFSIYKLCTGGTPLSFFSEGLLGYWFTLSLFELFLIYYVTSRFFAVLSSHGGSKMQDILYMMLIMTTWAIGLTMAHDAVGGHSVINVLNLQNTFVNMPFFLTGLLVRKHWQRVLSVLQGPRFFASCIVIFLAGSL